MPVIVFLNGVANACGHLLDPIGVLPGWLSATLVASITGIGLLPVFKCTSNQKAIKRVRRDIRANRLAAALFRDDHWLAVRSQARVLLGALRLLTLAIRPILAMTVPVVLLMGQLALWYQVRPLPVGAETTVTLKLNGDARSPMPAVALEPTPAIEDTSGPVRVFGRREVCWNVVAREAGIHRLRFRLDGQVVEKEIAIGNGFMRVSRVRPGWNWNAAALNPREEPFGPGATVGSIEIEYPSRPSWSSGTDNWVIYWFVVSLVTGLCFRRRLGVNL